MRKYLLKRDEPDDRDFKFGELMRDDTTKLPTSVDLRPLCPPVFDQLSLGSCHDSITEVLTLKGWKLFKDLAEGDLLASVDPESKNLIFEKYTNLIAYDYEGILYYAKHQSLDFAVTPNHNMLVRKWNQRKVTLDKEYSVLSADSLGWYCGLINSVKYKGIENKDDYTLPNIEHKRIESRKSKKVDMRLWLNLLGIYLAEGTMIKDDENHYKIQIACYKKREKVFIKDILEALDLNYCELKDRITFDNKQIYKEYESYGLLGVKAPYKFVPDFVFMLSSDNIKEFLLGYFNGDGCQSKFNRMFYTSSSTLSDQLQTLILLSGAWSNISIRPPRSSTMKDGRRVIGKHDEHCVVEWHSKNLSLQRKNNIIKQYYEGKVYCAEVPTYHTLVTRRNGKILISGNCTANAGVAAREMLSGNKGLNLSRLFLYYEERSLEGSISEDSGASMRDICVALQKYGTCIELLFPYDINKFTKSPTQQALKNAESYKINSYHSVASLNEIKQSVALKKPVLIGMTVYESMESQQTAQTGILPIPQAGEQVLGGHAVLVVGYSDTLHGGCLIVRNSWGTSWGQQGYFLMPYNYMNNGRVHDMWTIN